MSLVDVILRKKLLQPAVPNILDTFKYQSCWRLIRQPKIEGNAAIRDSVHGFLMWLAATLVFVSECAVGFMMGGPRMWSLRSSKVWSSDTPFDSVIEGVEMFLESDIDVEVEGRGQAHLFKARYEAPGAAVLYCFDDMREKAKTNLAEPGFRPGDVPPWIARQLVEFSLTTVMEDLVKLTIEAHDLEILQGDQGEETIRWIENPEEESKKFVLGSPYTFHASFNATLPLNASDEKTGGQTTIDALYSLTPASHNRAKNILDSGGKIPNLLKSGGGSSSSSKKKKKAKAGGGKKKRKR